MDVQLHACLRKKKKKRKKILLEKPLNVYHWGKNPKGSQTAASFKVLAVEHPRKKKPNYLET